MLEVAELCRSGERIACDSDVVVPEHDERPVKAREECHESGLTTGVGDQITRDADDVRSTSRHPVDGAGGRYASTRERSPQMKVGQMPDTGSVEDFG